MNGFGQGYHFRYEDPIHRNRTDASYSSQPAIIRKKPANDETMLSPYDRLAFATEVSIRYHGRRKQHYENVFRLMMVGVVFLAMSALAATLGHKIILTMSVVGLAMGTMVWNVTSKAREHAVLRSDYQTLFEQIRLTLQPGENDIRNWRNLRLRIQSKEPPVFWAVANDCYYEVSRAWGLKPRERGLPPVMLRPFMNWFRF